MAALPPVPNVLFVKIKYTWGQDVSTFNILHFQFSGSGPTNTQLVPVCQAIDTAIGAGWTLSMHPSVVVTEVTATDLSSSSAGSATVTTNRPGTAGGGPLPANTNVLINKVQQRRYRGGKPRSYVPMGTDTDLATMQSWAAASVTNFTTHNTTTMNGMKAITWPGGNITNEVCVSYYQGGTWVDLSGTGKGPYKRHPLPYPGGPFVSPITGYAVNVTPGTQRRRIRGKRT